MLTKMQMNARLKAYETVLQAIACWDYPWEESRIANDSDVVRARKVLNLFGVEPIKVSEADEKADQLLNY